MNNKKVPNPWGKVGGPEHRAAVKQTAEEILQTEMDFELEIHVPTPDGKKKGRFADIASIDRATNLPVNYYQIGKTNKNGTPIKREVEAMDDIETATGKRPIFKPYNLIIFALSLLTGTYLLSIL